MSALELAQTQTRFFQFESSYPRASRRVKYPLLPKNMFYKQYTGLPIYGYDESRMEEQICGREQPDPKILQELGLIQNDISNNELIQIDLDRSNSGMGPLLPSEFIDFFNSRDDLNINVYRPILEAILHKKAYEISTQTNNLNIEIPELKNIYFYNYVNQKTQDSSNSFVLEICSINNKGINLADIINCANIEDTNDIRFKIEKIHQFQHLAQLLDILHKFNIFHRDLKPQNLGYKSDILQLFDFGIALDNNQTLNKSFGSLRYMAPEWIVKRTDDYSKVDQYALVVIIAEILGGKEVFNRTNNIKEFFELSQQVIRDNFTSQLEDVLVDLNELVKILDNNHIPNPRKVAQILKLGTSSIPEDRFNNCEAAITSLLSFIDSEAA